MRRIARLLQYTGFWMAIALFLCVPVTAEGSKEMNDGDGYRAYTERYGMETAGQERDQVISVYANAGETIYFGDSVYNAKLGYTNEKLGTNFTKEQLAKLNSTDIRVTTSDWNPDTNPHGYPYVNGVKDESVLLYDTENPATETTKGYIANPAREQAGPDLTGNGIGYQPYSLVAEKTGVYHFVFYSASHSITNPKTVKTNEPWDQKGSTVAAWDTTVVSADGAIQTGRAYTDVLYLNVGSNKPNQDVLKFDLFVLTDDGYQYNINFNGMDPYGFVFFANNRGLLSLANGGTYSLNHSVKSDNNQLSDLETHNIGLNNIPYDPQLDHGYKIFFNAPSNELVGELSSPGSEVKDFKFTGKEGTENRGYVGMGGTFSFVALEDVPATSYQIVLFPTDANRKVVLSNTLHAGLNSIYWDGKDSKGNIVPAGTYTADQVKLQFKNGEIHFPLMDVENNQNGLIITRLNGDETDKNIVYYNNSSSTNVGDITPPWSAAKNWNVADKRDESIGVDSAAGAMAFKDKAGDQTALDIWAYHNVTIDLPNDYEFKLLNTKFTVTKVWEQCPETMNPTASIQLYNSEDIPVGSMIELNKTVPTYTWDQLDPRETYYVKEQEVPNFTVTYSEVTGSYQNEDGYKQTVTNTFVPTTFTVKKSWVDNGTHPGSVTVHLSADGVEIESTTLTAENDWTYTWKDLDSAKAYTVTEEDVSGYTQHGGNTLGNAKDGYYANIVNVTDNTNAVGVYKEWENIPEEGTPDHVTVQLQKEDGTAVDIADNTVELNKDNDWMYLWLGLEEGSYKVVEEEVLGYTTRIENTGTDPSFPIYKITNTANTISYTVNKQWEHGINNIEHPTSVKVQLQKSIDQGITWISVNGKRTLNEANAWGFQWEDLPTYTKDGTEIRYQVVEDQVSSYRTDYGSQIKDESGNVTQSITNTYLYTSVTVNKTWGHGTEPEADWPTSAGFKLLQNNMEYQVFWLTPENSWTNTVGHLPKWDADGNLYTYTIEETPIIGYQPTITSSTEGLGLIWNVANVYQDADVIVVKQWAHGTQAKINWPSSVTFQLYADGVAKGDPATVTEADEWKKTWTGLPAYNAENEKIVYTVKETPVAGYKSSGGTMEMVSSSKLTYAGTFTNTFQEPQPNPNPTPQPNTPEDVQHYVVPGTGVDLK